MLLRHHCSFIKQCINKATCFQAVQCRAWRGGNKPKQNQGSSWGFSEWLSLLDGTLQFSTSRELYCPQRRNSSCRRGDAVHKKQADKTARCIEIINKFITAEDKSPDRLLPAGGEGQREQWEEESVALLTATVDVMVGNRVAGRVRLCSRFLVHYRSAAFFVCFRDWSQQMTVKSKHRLAEGIDKTCSAEPRRPGNRHILPQREKAPLALLRNRRLTQKSACYRANTFRTSPFPCLSTDYRADGRRTFALRSRDLVLRGEQLVLVRTRSCRTMLCGSSSERISYNNGNPQCFYNQYERMSLL